MSVYKDEKRNSWYVKFRYVDYYGVKKQTTLQQREKQVNGKLLKR